MTRIFESILVVGDNQLITKDLSKHCRYSLRWSIQDGVATPVLYFDGKRVIEPWRLVLDVFSEGGGDVSA